MIGTEQAYFGYEKRLEEKLADTFNFIDHGNTKAEIERLRSLNAELVAALEDIRNSKRPVMWRVMDDNIWRVFSDEKEAQDYAEKIGMTNYQGLYVRDGT